MSGSWSSCIKRVICCDCCSRRNPQRCDHLINDSPTDEDMTSAIDDNRRHSDSEVEDARVAGPRELMGLQFRAPVEIPLENENNVGDNLNTEVVSLYRIYDDIDERLDEVEEILLRQQEEDYERNDEAFNRLQQDRREQDQQEVDRRQRNFDELIRRMENIDYEVLRIAENLDNHLDGVYDLVANIEDDLILRTRGSNSQQENEDPLPRVIEQQLALIDGLLVDINRLLTGIDGLVADVDSSQAELRRADAVTSSASPEDESVQNISADIGQDSEESEERD